MQHIQMETDFIQVAQGMEGKVRNDGEFQSHFRLFGSSV
jgi:hypothetical protein